MGNSGYGFWQTRPSYGATGEGKSNIADEPVTGYWSKLLINSTYGKVHHVQQEYRYKVNGCNWSSWATLGVNHTFRPNTKYQFRPKDRGAGYYQEHRTHGNVQWYNTDPGQHYWTKVAVVVDRTEPLNK